MVMGKERWHHRIIASSIVVVGLVPAVAALFSFDLLTGLRILVMVGAAVGTLWLSADGFDRRWTASLSGAAVRLLPVALTIIVFMMAFADPWTFNFGANTATITFAIIMVSGVAAAFWFRSRALSVGAAASPMAAVGHDSATPPPPTDSPVRSPSGVATRAHLLTALAVGVLLVLLSVFVGALAAYCSGSGVSFYALVASAVLVAGFVAVIAVAMDQRYQGVGGAGLAIGRVLLASLILVVLAGIVLSALPLPEAGCN